MQIKVTPKPKDMTNKQINHENKFKTKKYGKYKEDKRMNKHSGKSSL